MTVTMAKLVVLIRNLMVPLESQGNLLNFHVKLGIFWYCQLWRCRQQTFLFFIWSRRHSLYVVYWCWFWSVYIFILLYIGYVLLFWSLFDIIVDWNPIWLENEKIGEVCLWWENFQHHTCQIFIQNKFQHDNTKSVKKSYMWQSKYIIRIAYLWQHGSYTIFFEN